jgi:hypothetical protein
MDIEMDFEPRLEFLRSQQSINRVEEEIRFPGGELGSICAALYRAAVHVQSTTLASALFGTKLTPAFRLSISDDSMSEFDIEGHKDISVVGRFTSMS